MSEESFGCKLFKEFNLRQGAYFKSSIFNLELRKSWIDSYPKKTNRGKSKTIKDNTVLIVISQNCDIACGNDCIEDSIELLACKKIKSTDVFEGNQFVNSVRKFHFSLGEEYYEANADYILTVLKKEFFDALAEKEFNVGALLYTPSDILQSFKVWRTNRYSRTALPDNFNAKLTPIIDDFISKISKISHDKDGKNFIRVIYVQLDSMDEQESYKFKFFALLRDDTPNEIYSDIQGLLEDMCGTLSEQGYMDESDDYVGRDSDTFVSYLTSYVRFNLDTHSLKNGDYDPRLKEVVK